MKRVLKIIALCFASILGLIAGLVGYAFITDKFGFKKVNIETLAFSRSNFLVIDDFEMTFNYTPQEANNLDVRLKVTKGANAIKVPTIVNASKPFKIELKKDENGNNIGGEVEITAENVGGLALTHSPLKFWIDVAIPQDGLVIASNYNGNRLTAGGDTFKVFVLTNPSMAIYPDSRMDNKYFNKNYKNITLESSNPNDLEIMNNGVEGKVYFNPNYQTNNQPAYSDVKTTYHVIETRAKIYNVRPKAENLNGVTLTAKSLRTYAMEEEFVNVEDQKYSSPIEAFRDFSDYIEKFKEYIIKDTRSFTKGTTTYESGADFINKVTRTVNGVQKVDISSNSETEYEAAMFYLYVTNNISYTIENVKISKIITTNKTIEIPLFSNWQLNKTELINKFSINLVATSSNFTQDMILAKIGAIRIEALKGVVLENGELQKDDEGQLVLIPATNEFLITNPTENSTNPIWVIQSKNPQTHSNNGLRLRFSIKEGEETLYSDVLISSLIHEPGQINLKVLGDMTINSNLSSSITEVKTMQLNSSSYTIANPNSSFKIVKFFVTKESAKNSSGHFIFKLTDDFNAEPIVLKHFRDSNKTIEAYLIDVKVTFNNNTNYILEAINVTDRGPAYVFAAIIQTDYEGNPVFDEEGNLLYVEDSNVRPIEVTAYIDKLNFYTVNPETNEFIKRSISNNNAEITLLSNNTYKLYVTNLELDQYGNFDAENEIYVNREHINYLGNLTYALKKHAYGNENAKAENIYFGKQKLTALGDENVVEINAGNGWATYTFNEETNLIEVEISIVPRTSKIDTITNNNLPYFAFNLYADYKNIYPLDLKNVSFVQLKIVFASIEDDVKIINSSGQTNGIIEVTATATEGQPQWLYNINNVTGIFEITGVDFSYDIAKYDENGYISDKIDVAYNTRYFVEGYHRQVPQGQGDYIKNEQNKFDYVGAGNGNYVFVPGYIYKLANTLTTIKWESDKPNFLSISTNPDGTPNIDIKYGTPQGEIVTISVIIETYPDENLIPLQRKVKELKVKLIQEKPEGFFYSINTLPGIGEHLIENDTPYPFKMDGGTYVNLLQTLDSNLKVYHYTAETEENPIDTQVETNKLIDVRFTESNASIIGDITFKIQRVGLATPSIYFKTSTESDEKLYEAKATKILTENGFYYQLLLYSENTVMNSNETIKITDSFGTEYLPYHVKVTSNIKVTAPTGKNVTTNDTTEIDLNNEFSVTQTYNENTLRLPITFEVNSNFASVNNYSGNLFDIGQNIKGSQVFVVSAGGNATLTNVKTILTPNRVSEEKRNINVKLYYYVPKVDSFGRYVYVTQTGKLLHYSEELQTYVELQTYIDENGDESTVEVEYAGDKYYLFEKYEYANNENIGNIIIKPTYVVKKGQNFTEPLEIPSGTEYNLYLVKGNSNTPTTTNFFDIVHSDTDNLLLPDPFTIYENNVFDYSSVYNKYFVIYPSSANLTSEQLEIYNTLNIKIENGVLTTNSINSDLIVTFNLAILEGPLNAGVPAIRGRIINFTVKFLNSVKFIVNENAETLVEGKQYNFDIDSQTGLEIGHIYTDINKVKDGKIEIKENFVTIYDKTKEVSNNFVKLIGGNNEDLMRFNLSQLNLQYYDGYSYVPYNIQDKAVEVNWSKAGTETNSITLIFKNAVNQTTKFRLQFVCENFEVTGYYYFQIESNVTLSAQYPVYENEEVVTKNTTINLHTNYINAFERILINYNSNIYKLELIEGLMYLVNVNNQNDKILVVDGNGTSDNIPFFTYKLLDENKNILSNGYSYIQTQKPFPIVSRSYFDGQFTIANNITNSVFYIRVILFNGAFFDYKLNLQPSIQYESIQIKNNGVAITQSMPLVVNANNEVDLYKYIDLQYGSLDKLIVKYDNVLPTDVKAYILPDELITKYTNILRNEKIKFEDVSEEVFVTFSVYGYKFTSGMEPVKFYIKVIPNIEVENNLTEVAAGGETYLVNSSENAGIFELSGNTQNVQFEILTINNEPYAQENDYGVVIINNEKLYVHNIGQTISLQILVKKVFENNVTFTKTVTILVKPNVVILPDYNNVGNYLITAPAIGEAEPVFVTESIVDIKNIYGQNLKENEDVIITYKLLQGGSAVSNFNSQNGSFKVLKVNKDIEVIVTVSVEWLTNINPQLEAKFEQNVNIFIRANVSNYEITYSSVVSQTLPVYAGSTIELDFNNAKTQFAKLGNDDIKISATQKNSSGVYKDVNLILIASDNNDYYLRYENGKYLITFKHISQNPVVISIPLYLDLTGDDRGVVIFDSNNYYDTNLFIKFTVNSSVNKITLKQTYNQYTNSNNPLVVDYGNPEFVEKEGYFNLVVQDDQELHVYDKDGGDFDIVLNYERYTYVGANKGEYNFDGINYNYVGQNLGSYNKLGISQYDLFEMFNIELKFGLSFDSLTEIKIYKEYIKNSLIFTPYQNSQIVNISKDGIATFMPTNSSKIVAIQVSLYTQGNQSTTLYFAVGATSVLTSKSVSVSQDGQTYLVENNSNNRYVVNKNDTINLCDYVYYGYEFVSYIEDNAQNKTCEYDHEIYSVLKREIVGNDSSLVTVILNITKTFLGFTVAEGVNNATINNCHLTFNNITENTLVSVNVAIDGIVTTLYFYVLA